MNEKSPLSVAFRGIVGILAIAGALSAVAGLFVVEIPSGNRDAAMLAIGAVIGWAGSVVSWAFGSSVGSQRKTEIMERTK